MKIIPIILTTLSCQLSSCVAAEPTPNSPPVAAVSPSPVINEQLLPDGEPNRIVAAATNQRLYGNQLYQLVLYYNNEQVEVLKAVSGRPYAQLEDPDIPDIGAPLPAGEYWLGQLEFVETPYELGGIWIPAEPMFTTNRTYLGIHYDPSFQEGNPEQGTEGCLAVLTPADKQALINYMQTAQPSQLIVLGTS